MALKINIIIKMDIFFYLWIASTALFKKLSSGFPLLKPGRSRIRPIVNIHYSVTVDNLAIRQSYLEMTL